MEDIHPTRLNFEEWFYAFTMMAYKLDLPVSDDKEYYREMFFDIGYGPEDAIISEEATLKQDMDNLR